MPELMGWSTLLAVAAWLLGLAAVGVLNEVLARHSRIPEEVSRKLAHVAVALVVAGITVTTALDHRWWVVLGLCFVAVVWSVRRWLRLRSLARQGRHSSGELLYGVGIALVALVWSPEVFCCAVLALGLADPAAQLVGTRWPIRVLGPATSLGGMLGCGVVAGLVAAAVLPGPWWLAVPVAVVAALAEAAGRHGWDNITLPVAVAVTASGLLWLTG
ncbi:MAG TPA: hypothetical protein IAA98_12600 [Candidatus Avipropionibacterium avicola]|uniref:Phosphatidate cytidylyltransferase n=1 Tax=Candidatus Avipropionibacterium avicola TaxID=2840701 RepID=A0A9D1H079_9ACTN|nr:hypothetical protein [Candidatus Avipropionibacterium avicola]